MRYNVAVHGNHAHANRAHTEHPMSGQESHSAGLPPVPERLSRTIAELPSPRPSWPERLHTEVVQYVESLRAEGLPAERSLAALKQAARPLFDHSEALGGQLLGWVLEVYYGRRDQPRR